MAIIIRLSGNNVINATAAADQITTGSGNDTINAGEGANTIDAGDGNNRLTAGSGDDTITSGAGNDVINAGAGHNRIRAGAGNNVITSGAGNDDITSGSGNDVINAGAGNNTVNAGDGANVITTGSGNDTITTGSGNDVINAGDGNTTVGAGGGNNVITTGSGADSITSGSGNDVINAGNGNNTVTSGAGNDTITTGSGADLIDAGGNNDVVNSGTGNDVIVHRLAENAGSLDQYDGSSGQDTLRLDLSAAEWARADVQADVAAFLARANPAAFFRFNSTNLTVVNIERLEVFVEGVQLANPADELVTAVADSINASEDTPTASANLLLNDSVPDRALSVTLIGSSTLGTVSLASSLGGAVQTATLNFVPNASLQSLAQGETRSETLQYRVQDVNGDFSIASVTITVTGVNDAASISGDANGAVSEDSTTLASGQLSVSDVDTGENALQPVAAGTLGDNGLGSFEVLANGQWTYTLNNSLPAVQALNTGETLTDTLTVRSRDGTANQTLQVTIAGSDDATRVVIDLSTLSASQGFIIQGDAQDDKAGASVSLAGDVNGDGIGDLIVGAPGAAGAAGKAFVVFGRSDGYGTADANGRQVIDLSSLDAAQGFIIEGDALVDLAGWSVSLAGDVNGDGFDDVIVGAWLGDDGGSDASEAYVVFGAAGGFGTVDGNGRRVIDLTQLGTAKGFIIQGDETGDWAGYSVSTAGDVNGDGFDDLIVGAPQGDDGGGNAGEAYVVFGGPVALGTPGIDGRRVIDLSTLDAGQGFIIQGDFDDDQAGFSVSSAGDVNGDGIGDLIVGAPLGDDGVGNAGEAYVVFGGSGAFGTADASGRQVLDLSTLSATQGFIIQGDAAGDKAGSSVSSAGDVNGDGFDDLIVGAPLGDDGAAPYAEAGEAYVVFGAAVGFGTADGAGRRVIDLSNLTAAQGFIIQGDSSFNQAGFSVSSAGDVNGDGYGDLIVGAPFGIDASTAVGEAFVVFGAAGGFGSADSSGRRVIDLTSLSAAQGFSIRGDAGADQAGYSVSAAGDLNQDGFDDLIVGASDGDDGGTDAGEAYVVFGAAFGASATPVLSNGSTAAEILIGGRGNDQLAGGGGADVLRAGAGNDTLSVPDTAARRIDGGLGQDTLAFTGAGLSIDLSAGAVGLLGTRISGIETLDIIGTGDNALTLDASFLLDTQSSGNTAFTGAASRNNLVVLGNAGDTLTLETSGAVTGAAWSQVKNNVALDTVTPGDFDIYQLSSTGGIVAVVGVSDGVAVTLL